MSDYASRVPAASRVSLSLSLSLFGFYFVSPRLYDLFHLARHTHLLYYWHMPA